MSVWEIVLNGLLALAGVVATMGIGWLVPIVGGWLRTRSDQTWLQTIKDQAITLVDQLDQYIENGSATNESARAMAVAKVRNAVLASGGERRAKRVTGMDATDLAEAEVEAAVRQRQPMKQALKNGVTPT